MTHLDKNINKEFVGVDIAKDKYDVCYNDGSRKIFSNNATGHKKFIKSLRKSDNFLVTMEPTGGYEQSLIFALQDAGHDVILASGFRVKNYANAMGYIAKNDKIDAQVIQEFSKEMYGKGKLEILMIKSANFRKIEQWLNRRAQVIKLLTAEKQRHEKCIEKVIKTHLKKSIAFHEKELKLIDEKIEKLSQKEELAKRANKYQKIKGIGNVGANALVIYLPELGHYSNKVISALVGTAPYCRESGKYKGKSKTKGGRNKLRSILYMGVLAATTHNSIIKKFYDRLIRQGKHHNVAMIACMRKLLCILNAMERNNTEWDDNYGVANN